MNPDVRLIVCVNRRLTDRHPSCGARGSQALIEAILRGCDERGLTLPVEEVLCLGDCGRGPNLRLAPGGPHFHGVTLADLPRLLDEIQRFAELASA